MVVERIFCKPNSSIGKYYYGRNFYAKEERDVMSADVPNSFIQTKIPYIEYGVERVIMKITGVLVDLIIIMVPEVYIPYVVFENGRKLLYIQVLRSL